MTDTGSAGLRTGDSAKNPFIEVWRGIAVALVVYFHYTSRIPAEALHAAGPTFPFYSGKVGVLVFFVISGYLIKQSLTYSRNLASFYAKRLSRIWPLFIVAAITVFAVTRIFPPPVITGGDMPFNRNEVRFIDLFGTLFFLYDLGFHWVDNAFWSILVELKFYVIIGLFAAAWPGRFAVKFGAFAFAVGFVQLLIEFSAPPHAKLLSGVLNRTLVADYLPFFAIGVLMCAKRSGALLTVCVMLAFIQTALVVASNPYFEATSTLRFILAFTGVLALDAALFKSRIFLFLGYYSYAIYLFLDRVTEKANGGTDQVTSYVARYTLDANVENLALKGALAFDGTGNELANKINGNENANKLDGAAGDDKIYGFDGADCIHGGAGNDWVQGDGGNDVLWGDKGADTLIGGAGSDAFCFASGDSVATATSVEDKINDFGAGDLIFIDGHAVDMTLAAAATIKSVKYADAFAAASKIVAAGSDTALVHSSKDAWLFWDANHDGKVDSGVLLVGAEARLSSWMVKPPADLPLI